jgi:hypothetical protein
MVTMEHEPNPQYSNAQLTNLNLNNFIWLKFGIKNYRIEVPMNSITSVPNFMKIYQAVQKLLVWDTHTDVQIDKTDRLVI